MTGEETGTIDGGYAATIEDDRLDDPPWPTTGFVGPTDYGGVIEDTDDDTPLEGHRDNPVRWQDPYFDVDGSAIEWWGWLYEDGRCGTLTVEAGPDPCGDIVRR